MISQWHLPASTFQDAVPKLFHCSLFCPLLTLELSVSECWQGAWNKVGVLWALLR